MYDCVKDFKMKMGGIGHPIRNRKRFEFMIKIGGKYIHKIVVREMRVNAYV